MSEEAPS